MALMRSVFELTDSTLPLDQVMPGNLALAKILCHLRKPENILGYLIFSAWMKFMGVASHIPTITLG